MKALLGILMAMAPAVAFAQDPLALGLVCRGKLAIVEDVTTTGTISAGADVTKDADVKTHQWVTKYLDARLNIELQDGAGRVRPSWGTIFGRKSADGWYPIETLQIGEASITGRVTLGMITKPRVFIDRRTGDVEFGDFKGNCEKSDVAPGHNKF